MGGGGGLTVLQVEQARLANVLQFRARLAHLGLLEAHALTRLPSKHRERPLTDLTLLQPLE